MIIFPIFTLPFGEYVFFIFRHSDVGENQTDLLMADMAVAFPQKSWDKL
jgi:hypothetical protein